MAVAGKYLGIFVDEGRDLVKRIGARLLRIEEAPEDLGAMESALRMVHTLKGSSKMVGLDNVSRGAHAIENVLKDYSTGSRELASEDYTKFFTLLDDIENVLTLVASGRVEEGRSVPLALTGRPSAPAETNLPAVEKKPETVKPAPWQPERESAPRHDHPAFDQTDTEQTKPLPGDGLRVNLGRIDRLQEQVEDLIVQKWQIFAALDRLGRYFAERDLSSVQINGKQRATIEEPLFTNRDMVAFSEEIHRMATILGDLQLSIMELRMVPLSDLLAEYRRMVRDLSISLGKDVHLRIEGENTEVDRNLLEGLQGPLTHLVRNALDHGVETPEERIAAGKDPRASVVIRAYQKPGAVVVEVEDDGRGLDAEKIRQTALEKGFLSDVEAGALSDLDAWYLLCRSGFTTRSTASEVSGRGVGLDAVKVRLERLRGSLSIASEKGSYSLFRMFLPQSLSTLRGLIAKAEEVHAAFPTVFVEKCIGTNRETLAKADGMVEFEGEKLVPVSLSALFGREAKPPTGALHVIILSFRRRRMALAVDRIEREQDLVVKNLDAHLQHASSVLGVSLLADGTPAPIIDIPELYERWPGLELSAALPAPVARQKLRILVVDDAVTSRHVESTILESLGHEVEQAGDGLQAIRILEKKPFDLVVTDLEMPHVDGIELVREIRRDDKLHSMPVIMVTSVSDDETVDKSYEAGVNAYLTKDRLSRQVLARSIRNLFPG